MLMNSKRRTFLKYAGLGGVSLLAARLGVNRASADPDPRPDAKAPASALSDVEIHAFPFGGAEAFVIHDGKLTLPSIQPAFVPEAGTKEIEELQSRSFLPANQLALSLNVLVVKTKSGITLFDAGAGQAFGPIGGKLIRGLARIGILPRDVKTVYVTHAHSDHIAGLLDAANKPVFPAAKIIAAKPEVDFWTGEKPDLSGMRMPSEETAKMAASIKTYLEALKPNLELHAPGKLSDEVELALAPGHTPGHTVFHVRMGGEELIVLGDAVHVHSLQFPHPEWTMSYDVNPAQAIVSRRRLFKAAAGARTLLMGYHLPFPGLGHARPAGEGYEWVPKPWVV